MLVSNEGLERNFYINSKFWQHVEKEHTFLLAIILSTRLLYAAIKIIQEFQLYCKGYELNTSLWLYQWDDRELNKQTAWLKDCPLWLTPEWTIFKPSWHDVLVKKDSTWFYCLLSGDPEACCFLQVLLLSSRRTHPHLKCHRVQLDSRLQRLQSFDTTWPIGLSLQTVRQPASPSRPNHLTPPLTSQSQPRLREVAGHFLINCTSHLFI